MLVAMAVGDASVDWESEVVITTWLSTVSRVSTAVGDTSVGMTRVGVLDAAVVALIATRGTKATIVGSMVGSKAMPRLLETVC